MSKISHVPIDAPADELTSHPVFERILAMKTAKPRYDEIDQRLFASRGFAGHFVGGADEDHDIEDVDEEEADSEQEQDEDYVDEAPYSLPISKFMSEYESVPAKSHSRPDSKKARKEIVSKDVLAEMAADLRRMDTKATQASGAAQLDSAQAGLKLKSKISALQEKKRQKEMPAEKRRRVDLVEFFTFAHRRGNL